MIKQLLLLLLLLPFFIFSQDYNNKYDSVRNVIIEKGRQAYFDKELDKLKEITNEVLGIYTQNKDSVLLAKYYHFKALQSKLAYKNDSAFYYYHESKNISKKIKDSLQAGRRLLSIAILQKNIKDFLGSEISSIEALQYLEPIQSVTYLERVFNNLGTVSKQLNQQDEALDYYNKALDLNKRVSNNIGFLNILNNIGLLYQEEEKHKKAIVYFKKGLTSFKDTKEKYPAEYCLLYENLAFSHYKLGKKKSIVDRFEEVLKIREKDDNLRSLSTTHLNLAEFFKEENNYVKAKFHAKEGLKFATQTHNNERWLEALKTLSELSTGNDSKKYLEEYITLNDSLITQERQLKNQFAKIRYETDKKEKENTFLKAENEQRVIEVEKQRQQKIIGWLVATLSILILASSVSFFSFRRKKLLFQAQLQKIEAREKERRQIAKSLHDEVAGDLRLLHLKLAQTSLLAEAEKLELVKDNVRNLSHQLSSVSFEKVNFTDQIINLISDYFAPNFIIRAHDLKKINWEEINNSIKRVLYLSIRESIQNCEKYAQASRMDISFKVHKKSVFLAIQDNGIGFDTTTSKKGIGLQNMQERVEELQGKLTISSEVQKGTSIEIQVPLNA
ncbi:tetratricopeptide repeat-containing sensor histidine kinase [uncultured Tenacibaculum sp.]|uniref:tetratricopeptide repeat-containing sensor histidine kinase n=1 Tax=uncultured Tenacibaculum sp. TaxID=174713 RepID=UPI00261A2B5C|nr:tetratricopeptide repeat-containing sensor histidine kinase [uncultured Tenacibaculum sp.]